MHVSHGYPGMVWHRLPSFLPNFVLRLLPLSEKQLKTYAATGFVRDVSFRTAPQTTKVSCLALIPFWRRQYQISVNDCLMLRTRPPCSSHPPDIKVAFQQNVKLICA